MANIPGLRSPYDQVGGIVHFGRMLDKIRLHARGGLPAEYSDYIGAYPGAFDQFCLNFLRVHYAALTKRTLEGGSDDEVLAWAFENGRQPTPEEILIWNSFLSKRGWRDDARARAEVDVVAALQQVTTARARQTVGAAAVAQARESQRIIRDRFDAGLAPVTDVLRAASAVLDADARRVTALVDLVTGTARLNLALGRVQ